MWALYGENVMYKTTDWKHAGEIMDYGDWNYDEALSQLLKWHGAVVQRYRRNSMDEEYGTSLAERQKAERIFREAGLSYDEAVGRKHEATGLVQKIFDKIDKRTADLLNEKYVSEKDKYKSKAAQQKVWDKYGKPAELAASEEKEAKKKANQAKYKKTQKESDFKTLAQVGKELVGNWWKEHQEALAKGENTIKEQQKRAKEKDTYDASSGLTRDQAYAQAELERAAERKKASKEQAKKDAKKAKATADKDIAKAKKNVTKTVDKATKKIKKAAEKLSGNKSSKSTTSKSTKKTTSKSTKKTTSKGTKKTTSKSTKKTTTKNAKKTTSKSTKKTTSKKAAKKKKK